MELYVENATQPQHHLRSAFVVHAAKLPHTGVSGQQIAIALNKRFEARATDLLLAFHEELDARRQPTRHGPHRTHSGQPRDELSLVVRHPARIKPALALRR